jgi:hypothetical protein
MPVSALDQSRLTQRDAGCAALAGWHVTVGHRRWLSLLSLCLCVVDDDFWRALAVAARSARRTIDACPSCPPTMIACWLVHSPLSLSLTRFLTVLSLCLPLTVLSPSLLLSLPLTEPLSQSLSHSASLTLSLSLSLSLPLSCAEFGPRYGAFTQSRTAGAAAWTGGRPVIVFAVLVLAVLMFTVVVLAHSLIVARPCLTR